jgi:hypothetical protein
MFFKLTASVSGTLNQELTRRAVYESEQSERIFMENTSLELSIYDPQGSALPLGILLPTDSTTSAISALSDTEEKMLEHYETIIEQGEKTLIEVGQALSVINRGKLYRAEYGSFEEYCREKWGFGRQRAYENIKAAEIATELYAKGVQINEVNERQLRAVAKLSNAEQRVEAFSIAKKSAGRKKVNSRHIEEAVNEMLGIKKPVIIDVEAEPEPQKKSNAVMVVTSSPDPETNEAGINRLFQEIRQYAESKKWDVGFNNLVDELQTRVQRLMPTELQKAG